MGILSTHLYYSRSGLRVNQYLQIKFRENVGILFLPLHPPKTLHDALPLRLAVHSRGDGRAQEGEDGDQDQDGGDAEAVGIEPIGVFQEFSRQGVHGGGKEAGDQSRTQGVEEALPDEHGLELRSGHTYGLEHGEFPLAGEDGGHHGVDEVQDSHNADNGAQKAAQDGKGALKLAEVGTVVALLSYINGESGEAVRLAR